MRDVDAIREILASARDGAEGIRTLDLYNANVALYQLSHNPVTNEIILPLHVCLVKYFLHHRNSSAPSRPALFSMLLLALSAYLIHFNQLKGKSIFVTFLSMASITPF